MFAFRKGQRYRKQLIMLITLVATATALVFVFTAGSASLPGSSFEIDNPAGDTTGANLTVDGGAGALDWMNVNEIRQADAPTGPNDNSYAGGVKEDDACPGQTTGSIPNNKSDLLSFGGYHEAAASGPGFLHVFWARVNSPQGTTNMDFEFNKSTTACSASSPNVTRTAGDILLQFDVDQGGKVATLSKREWSGTAWGTAVPLTANVAIGAINQQPILAANSDGLISSGSLSARTFGEASFDLSSVFDPGKCESFGSAMLKSRSSDAFNSQLKDFISPIPVNIHNCAQVIIRKVTDPPNDPTLFDYTKSFGTDPSTGNTFQLAGGGVKDFGKTVLFGNGYTVTEGAVPTSWEFVSLDCNVAAHPSVGVTPNISGQTVTFDINNEDDVLDCTYTNQKHLGAIKVTKVSIKGNAPLAGAVFSVSGSGNLTTGVDGSACVDHLAFGDYTVQEVSAPGGYAIDDPASRIVTVDNNAECDDAVFGGELEAFTDTPLTDITATAHSQAAAPGGTVSNVSCVDQSSGLDVGNSPQSGGDAAVGATGLHPGTYVCTIVVDP